MAYSISPKTLERIRPLLKPLEEGTSWRWTAPGAARLLAYKLREGLYIARLYREQYPDLARASENFRIQVIDNDNVQATQKQSFTTEVMAAVESHNGEQPTAMIVSGTEIAGKPHELVGPTSAAQIVGFWTSAQPSNSAFTFPQATLDMAEMVKLYEWATERKLLIFYSNGRITLQRRTKSLEGLEWTPADGLD